MRGFPDLVSGMNERPYPAEAIDSSTKDHAVVPTSACSGRNLRVLDALSLCVTDLRVGGRPYLAGYLLIVRKWRLEAIGLVMSIAGIAQIAAQAPAGWIVDACPRKRGLIVFAAATLALALLTIALSSRFSLVLAAQVAVGIATALLLPSIAALSLELVGYARIAERIGRNESLSHMGTVLVASIVASLGHRLGLNMIFYVLGAMAGAAALTATAIREDGVGCHPDTTARPENVAQSAAKLSQLAADARIRHFIVAIFLFHLANGAMLTMVGEKISSGGHAFAPYAAACVGVSQVVMMLGAGLAGRAAARVGRKPVLMVAFAVEPVRALLYVTSENPAFLTAVQVLDGVGAGIFGVVAVVIAADLARGTGRFSLVQGAMNASVGAGTALSDFFAGVLASRCGYNCAFIALAGIAMVAAVFFAIWVPESGAHSAPSSAHEPPDDEFRTSLCR